MISITWQPGYGIVSPTTRTGNAARMRGMHGAGQMRRDTAGRLRHANGRFA